ncbi:hypothetical protein MTR_5g095390 [Medicago truncatula]|nr:hypothetical protein MTR_5g095390 [Medicago truncatula]
MEPKTEPVSPPYFHFTNPNNNLEDKSIHDLVLVLRGTCQWETFDSVEAVLESRDIRLREENQKLQQDFEMERLKLKEQLDMEILSRLHAEFEFRKREEICSKVQENYEALLKEVKVNRKSNEALEKKNNEVDVLRRKIVELENEVLELKKLKKKWEEDDIELGVLRKMIGELQSKIGELEETVKKNLATMNELRNESRKLTEEKCEVEILLKALKRNRKFIRVGERAATSEEDIILLTSLEEEVPMVDHFEENVGDNEFRNEDAYHTLGVAGSRRCLSSSAGGSLKLENEIEIINHDNDDDQSISRGVHEKKACSGITANPCSSVALATQQESKFSNAVDRVKRKSSFDGSLPFLHNLTIWSGAKKKNM